MTAEFPQLTYRETTLPGLGRVLVPTDMSDAEVLTQLTQEAPEATAKKKTKKKS